MIKRFNFMGTGISYDGGMEEEKDGEYVLYSDYEKLEKENEELKEALKHALNFVNVKYESIDSFMEHWRKEYDLVYIGDDNEKT